MASAACLAMLFIILDTYLISATAAAALDLKSRVKIQAFNKQTVQRDYINNFGGEWL